MAIEVRHKLPVSADQVWQIVGDPGRIDWVAGVAACGFDGEIRRFQMQGAGQLAERIVQRDDETRCLRYSVVESTPPLASHLATLTVAEDGAGCEIIWQTEVQPTAVEPFIEQGMRGSLVQLESVLGI